MEGSELLKMKLNKVDGRDYGAYQSLKGEYDFGSWSLIIHQIPKDPYAPPHTGLYTLIIPHEFSGIGKDLWSSRIRKTALGDFTARSFYRACESVSRGRRGTGFSGLITIEKPGQIILERSSVFITDTHMKIRFFIGLPAKGRLINAVLAEEMLFSELIRITELSMKKVNFNFRILREYQDTAEDSEYLRGNLEEQGLVAFIPNGARLAREAGNSDLPLDAGGCIIFKSPPTLETEFDLPNRGRICGMGIPRGVNLIVGGGYHGKSTLLNAVELGIYNFIPGDGREYCVALGSAAKVRAYSGRFIEKVDISMFINNLPFGKDTRRFSTTNASGSTSQAASICEAVEIGTELLIMDEDTCATNFLVRDRKMQELVCEEDEPITTYIDRIRLLYTRKNISSILVLGGIGDYFDVSDCVIQMKRYLPLDVTADAHKIIHTSKEKRKEHDSIQFPVSGKRILSPYSINPENSYGKVSVYVKEKNQIHFGDYIIDLTDLEQIADPCQTKAIAQTIIYMMDQVDGKRSLKEMVETICAMIEEKGLGILSDRALGTFAAFRKAELAGALNRLRSLVME